MWPACRKELRAFLGLMPLAVARWKSSWCTKAQAYNSCDEGRGHCQRDLGQDVVRELWAIKERSRYHRRYGGTPARKSALRRLDPFADRETVLTAAPNFEQTGEFWEENVNFPEVDLEVVLGHPLASGRPKALGVRAGGTPR